MELCIKFYFHYCLRISRFGYKIHFQKQTSRFTLLMIKRKQLSVELEHCVKEFSCLRFNVVCVTEHYVSIALAYRPYTSAENQNVVLFCNADKLLYS